MKHFLRVFVTLIVLAGLNILPVNAWEIRTGCAGNTIVTMINSVEDVEALPEFSPAFPECPFTKNFFNPQNPKYDADFFADNFLVHFRFVMGNSSVVYHSTSFYVQENVIYVEIMRASIANAAWPMVHYGETSIELCRSLEGKEISVLSSVVLKFPPYDTPVAPTIVGIPSATSVTLNDIEGLEFRIATPIVGEWQSSPVFTGLIPNTEYTFHSRFAALGNISASKASLPSAVVRTAFSPSVSEENILRLKLHIAGHFTLICEVTADVSGDGIITPADVRILRMQVVQKYSTCAIVGALL